MFINNNIKYVGVNDHKVDLFEGQYVVPNGMAYNSYLLIDEKVAVFDTVSEGFGDEWLNNIKNILGDREPDYLVVSHMEPDHSANILQFAKEYKNSKIVATSKAFVMMKNFFGTDFSERAIAVNEGDTLSLGQRTLTFITAPMVHWPEVMVTYDNMDKVLFSADAFGKFGALDIDEEWDCEARRYYIGIVGKYGVQVQSLLKKLKGAEVDTICPLHGPILNGDLSHYLNLYDIWSSYNVESEGVMIAYTSVYGNTKKAVKLLEENLIKFGCKKVVVTDLAREDMAEAVEDAFRYGKIVLATTTYNGEIFPFMKEFIGHLQERNYQNRKIGFIENGSWAPVATKVMKQMLEKCRNLQFTDNNVKILSAVNQQNIQEIELLAKEILED